MQLIWLTDLHLNFLDTEQRIDFYKKLASIPGEHILISGDIAEAPSLSQVLKEMAETMQKPIHFVLGNHDYYHNQVDAVRAEIGALTQNHPFLNWLQQSGARMLNDETLLVGADTWADGRAGDYAQSTVVLNDSRMIVDLLQKSAIGKEALLNAMQTLADSDAEQLKSALETALTQHRPKKVIVLTHIPPFAEACLYEGQQAGGEYLPFFCSKITGDILLQMAEKHPEIHFLTLCGHTHSKTCIQPRANLTVKVGSAEYSKPDVQEVLTL